MFKFISKWALRLANWADPGPNSVLLKRSKELTAEWESRLGSGFGEAKRHQVYAQLIKDFPLEPKRNISKAIEAVL